MLIRYSLAAKALATCLVATPAYAPVYRAAEPPLAAAAQAGAPTDATTAVRTPAPAH